MGLVSSALRPLWLDDSLGGRLCIVTCDLCPLLAAAKGVCRACQVSPVHGEGLSPEWD